MLRDCTHHSVYQQKLLLQMLFHYEKQISSVFTYDKNISKLHLLNLDNLLPVKGFSSIVEARKWVYSFVNLYNTEFLHSGIKFATPYQIHYGLDIEILAKRDEVYQAARNKKPERWARNTRDWSRIEQVALNPANESELLTSLLKKMQQLPRVSNDNPYIVPAIQQPSEIRPMGATPADKNQFCQRLRVKAGEATSCGLGL